MYYSGLGVPQDYAQAVKLYRVAAEQGLAGAQHDLGVLYLKGQGVPQNYVLAHMWFNLAASQIPASKKTERNSAVSERDSVESKMTPEQIAEAQKLVLDWKPKRQQ
jgi:TPR repeat protein